MPNLHQPHRSAASLLAVLLAASAVGACTPLLERPPIDRDHPIFEDMEPGVPELRNDEPAISHVPLSQGLFAKSDEPDSDPIPGLSVRNLSVASGGTAEGLFSTLLADSSLSVTFDAEAASRTGFVASRYNGTLASLVEDAAERMDIWYRYADGVLRFTSERRFSVEIPPMFSANDVLAMEGVLRSLRAKDIVYDPSSNVLVYRAGPAAQRAVSRYLEKVRDRDMIVYDVYVYEVALSDRTQLGINWRELTINKPDGAVSLSGGGSVSNGINVAGTFTRGSFSLTALLQFLQTQGTVRAVSQPQISVMSGHTASFVVGEVERILSQVGATVGTGFSQVTTETEEIETGLRVLLRGAYRGGRVWTEVNLTQSDQLQGREVEVGGTTVFLPRISNRDVKTTVTARPGDTLLLSGLIQHTSNKESSGLGGGLRLMVPTSKSDQRDHAEMVMVMRPRIVRFRPVEDFPMDETNTPSAFEPSTPEEMRPVETLTPELSVEAPKPKPLAPLDLAEAPLERSMEEPAPGVADEDVGTPPVEVVPEAQPTEAAGSLTRSEQTGAKKQAEDEDEGSTVLSIKSPPPEVNEKLDVGVLSDAPKEARAGTTSVPVVPLMEAAVRSNVAGESTARWLSQDEQRALLRLEFSDSVGEVSASLVEALGFLQVVLGNTQAPVATVDGSGWIRGVRTETVGDRKIMVIQADGLVDAEVGVADRAVEIRLCRTHARCTVLPMQAALAHIRSEMAP